MDLFTAAMQLGVGGIAVAGIIITAKYHADKSERVATVHAKGIQELQANFLRSLDERADKHERAMTEREAALRAVEQDVRKTLTEQLTQNTMAMKENTRIMERVVTHLDTR